MSELKLRRLIEHNQRLREDLGRPRIRVSEASASIIRYCKTTTDHLVSLSSLPLPCPPFPSFAPPREAPHSENLALSVTDASFLPVIGTVRVGPR
jgi:guanine nucleotide-binding protein subunit gamma